MSEVQPVAAPVTPEHFSEWNEAMVQRFDPEVFHHHPRRIVRWVEHQRRRAVLRSLDVRPQDRLLDVGCGAGNLLDVLSAHELHGIDLSPSLCNRAQQRLGNKAKIVLGDAEQLPYPDMYFDRVVASSVLPHVLHPEQVVAEMKRVTKPGGRVVLSISDEVRIERGIRWLKRLGLYQRLAGKRSGVEVFNVEYHLHRFSHERVQEVIGGKLQMLKAVRVPWPFPVHWVISYQA